MTKTRVPSPFVVQTYIGIASITLQWNKISDRIICNISCHWTLADGFFMGDSPRALSNHLSMLVLTHTSDIMVCFFTKNI